MYAYKEGSSSSVVPVVKISDIPTKATLPMNYELEVFICGESQGVESGTSFHDCIRELFTVTHHVPEQFPPDYVSVILKCLHEISCKIAENYDYGDLSYEMDGEVTASGFIEGHWQMDQITVVFRGKDNVSN